jgi:glycosyltransferase involved in cell wall biosynthesis
MSIDIIIPAYNCHDTIQRTLDSLVAQTNQNFTVLVVDDCSTQNIALIVEEYIGRLTIRYVRNPENRGCGMSRQRGIDETKAEYISFLDSDDVLLPSAVDTWLKEIEGSRPDVIYTPFFYAARGKIRLQTDSLFMCHGKVYSIDFLRKYDIRESEKVECLDDSYLNWQVFDLAHHVSLLKEPTYIYIDTKDSVTKSDSFRKKSAQDFVLARSLALKQISRFKENPLSNYRDIDTKVLTMLSTIGQTLPPVGIEKFKLNIQ